MIYRCANGRRLIVSTKETVRDIVSDSMVPSVVLFPVSRNEQAVLGDWGDLIQFVLDRGCEFFVCAGSFSEQLHDAIDDVIFQSTEKYLNRVVTTYHKDEEIGDITEFFVRSTSMRDASQSCLVAVLDEKEKYDAALMMCLLVNLGHDSGVGPAEPTGTQEQ